MNIGAWIAVIIVAVGIVDTTKMTVAAIMKIPDLIDAGLAWIERRIEASIDRITDRQLEIARSRAPFSTDEHEVVQ